MNNIITGPQQRKCFCTPSFVEKTLRKIDKFGHPITLTHEDEDSFKSSFGGVMTILTIIGLVVFFGLEVQRALDQSKYNITTSRQIRNYYYDNTEYNIDYKAFDFAVRLSYVGTQNVNIEQYFSINFYDYFYDLKENYTEGEFPRTIVQPKLEKIKCTSDRLGGFTSGIDDSSKFWCTKRTNYTVKGGMVNAKIKYIQMALNYCQNETLWGKMFLFQLKILGLIMYLLISLMIFIQNFNFIKYKLLDFNRNLQRRIKKIRYLRNFHNIKNSYISLERTQIIKLNFYQNFLKKCSINYLLLRLQKK